MNYINYITTIENKIDFYTTNYVISNGYVSSCGVLVYFKI